MASPFAGKNVLVTGGAGYLGRGFLRLLRDTRSSANVTVYSRDEQKHYALRAKFPHVKTVIGDIRDTDRLTAVMAGQDIIIHAAALKHVPEAERDVSEAIANNVLGSQSVITAALRAGVQTVCGISTDKVCSPVNTYGATKMLMERAFQEAARMSPHTRFVCVRYGNVISSTGSVVPIFRDQIRQFGEVTITNLAMTRFWIRIDDALELIAEAVGDRANNGHTYVYRCGSMRILDVAQSCWQLEGREGTVQYRLIGTRPGEKFHETLVDQSEARYAQTVSGGAMTIIPPAYSQSGEGTSDGMAYTSDAPTFRFFPDEFVETIKDAMTV